jgi:hypothetical protein
MENVLDVIELLAKNEEHIKQLYTVYANRFPEHRAFWNEMAFAEFTHATWIRKLANEITKNCIKINPGRFHRAAIETTISYVKNQIANAGSADITPNKAVSIAADIENSMLEKKFFEIYDNDCQELKNTLEYLKLETESHRESVNNYMIKLNKQNKQV